MVNNGSVATPSVSLPKGGGAVTGISEALQADAFTGTASLAITLPISPGRGLQPQLRLDYNSGSGNGLFGMGFSLDLPSIARKTARAIPRYDESDTFLFSNGEDLVPCLINQDGVWTPERHYRLVAGNDDSITQTPPTDGVFFVVERFRPRVEGLFARVERWTRSDDGDMHWRVISADNVTSVYGESAAARIADPADPARIFRWLIERTFDATGEQIVYAYRADGGNAYPHTITYGNVRPQSDAAADEWHFAIGFDYSAPPDGAAAPGDQPTQARPDPFTSYRSGFAIRTALRCVQITMSHRFAELADNRLTPVAALIFTYEDDQRLSLLQSVRQVGYRDGATGELPPLQFAWSRFDLGDDRPLKLQQIRLEDGAPFPNQVESGGYQFVDLYGEGLPGILYTDAQTILYSRPLGDAHYAAPEPPFSFPVEHELHAETHSLVDLAGDGRLDLVVTTPMRAGAYAPRLAGGWEPFRSFAATPGDLFHPQRRLADVTGDGLADLLLVEPGAVTCYPSRGRLGYGSPTVQLPPDALPVTSQPDAREVVRFADPFGDGGSHLVRVRNGSVACWPSLGYGRFGPQVEFANPPRFGEELDGERLFFADIDGSGPVDLIYAHTDRIDIYMNQGSAFSDAIALPLPFPWSALSRISFADVLGNGTACLVLTSVAPDLRLTHHYYDFTNGAKPYLLTGIDNAMGATTNITYRSSTHFFLADAQAGTPWITRLPFPVQVVAQIETLDRISGSRLTASYSYHHGFFDPIDRAFRGFGRVDRLDAEALDLAAAQPYDQPPALTRSWYHLGAYADAGRIAQQYAAEYYQGDAQAEALAELHLDPAFVQAPDSVDEALRALHGHLLREELYGADAGEQPERAAHPYLVSATSYAVRLIQPRAGHAYAACLVYPSEAISRHYERNPADPRVSHDLTLEVDAYGNVLRSLTVAYGRRSNASDQTLSAADRASQAKTWITYAEHSFTNAVDTPDAYHVPLPCESRAYELTGFAPQGGAERFSIAEWMDQGFARLEAAATLAYEQAADGSTPQRRLIGQTRTLYRPDDLGGAQGDDPLALLPWGRLEPLALHGETYSLALTPGLLQQTYTRDGQDLLPADRSATPAAGGYVDLDKDGHWWQPGGRHFLSPGGSDTAAQELAYARAHFFRPRRFRDPFHSALQSTEEVVTYDAYDLLPVETRDALGNTVQAEHDYRVLQPRQITDPNGNRSAVAFDALGMVVATAVMGKAGADVGDSLEDVAPDLTLADLQAFMADPQAQAATLLGGASSRIIYDRDRFRRAGQPPCAATLARETHLHDQPPPHGLRIQIVITYADGFGRELQQKLLAEAGEAPARLADVTLPSGDVSPGALIQGQGGPATTGATTRWIGSGRTIYTNKGLPARQYEPFFSTTHLYEGEAEVAELGVSSTLLYDPLGRAVATLHPNHSWQKHVFNPWRAEQWDVSDTLLIADPGADPDVGHLFRRLPGDAYLPTWHALRTDPAHAAALAARYPDPDDRAGEAMAAAKAGLAAATPEVTHLDALGRAFLQVAHNRYRHPDTPPAAPPVEEHYATRVVFDIEGNQRAVIDAAGRIAMRAAYDLHGRRIFLSSIDAGERWTLSALDGKPVLAWDSRGYRFRSEYDALRRPVRSLTAGLDPAHPERERPTERLVYGEQHPDAISANLRGRLWRHLDQAGLLEAAIYDFKGNLLRSTRRLARSYRETIDWGPAEAALLIGGTAGLTAWLEDEAFTSSARYDALDRPLELIAPDQSVVRPSHNQTGRLERIEATLRGAAASTVFVAGITYNAKGRRTRIDYGNGAGTAYDYDPQTFDLIRLNTTRRSDSAALQALRYTYDPAEQILRIRDDAQQTIFFRNRRVAPGGDYTYDAVHRLIAATGREHLGQAGATPAAYTPDDAPRVGLAHPGDGDAMGRYAEQYVYDALGNLLRMQHRDDAGRGWARNYAYDPASHRLIQTSIDGANPAAERYAYDAHGNMTAMPHLPLMQWNAHDQLRASARQVVTNGGTPETTWYVYDAAGQRVRQVTERQAAAGQQPTRKSERIYLGGFEIYREYAGDGATVRLERETLHVIDDEQTVALVETRTRGNDSGPRQVTRYQLADHLGSAMLELDAQAQIISYEEYSPYGSTSYQAARSRTEAPKRYRYSGKERDDATGFAYYGARYYAPWLARWTSPDPAGMIDGPNLYAFVRGNPIGLVDIGGFGGGSSNKKKKTKKLAPKAPKNPGAKKKSKHAAATHATVMPLVVQAEMDRRKTIDPPPGIIDPGATEIHFVKAHYDPATQTATYHWSKKAMKEKLVDKKGDTSLYKYAKQQVREKYIKANESLNAGLNAYTSVAKKAETASPEWIKAHWNPALGPMPMNAKHTQPDVYKSLGKMAPPRLFSHHTGATKRGQPRLDTAITTPYLDEKKRDLDFILQQNVDEFVARNQGGTTIKTDPTEHYQNQGPLNAWVNSTAGSADTPLAKSLPKAMPITRFAVNFINDDF